MSELKSAKTFSADESRPFSERTVRRLRRIGEVLESRIPPRALDRSAAERVGFSVMANAMSTNEWQEKVTYGVGARRAEGQVGLKLNKVSHRHEVKIEHHARMNSLIFWSSLILLSKAATSLASASRSFGDFFKAAR